MQVVTSIAFPVPVLHWPTNRAKVTASVKSFVGLGGAVVAQSFRLLYGSPSEDPVALRCMLLWAGICLGCTLVGSCAMPRGPPAALASDVPVGSAPQQPPQSEPRTALDTVYLEIATLGVIATATPLVPDGPLHTALVALMLALALLPIPLATLVDRRRATAFVDLEPTADSDAHGRRGALLAADTVCRAAESVPRLEVATPAVPEAARQLTTWQMVRTLHAWMRCLLTLTGRALT
jgi:hypothetical protein